MKEAKKTKMSLQKIGDIIEKNDDNMMKHKESVNNEKLTDLKEEASADCNKCMKIDDNVNQDAHSQDAAALVNNTELKNVKKTIMSFKKLGDIIVVNNTANPTGRHQNHEDWSQDLSAMMGDILKGDALMGEKN